MEKANFILGFIGIALLPALAFAIITITFALLIAMREAYKDWKKG